jgi:hypothetical protein
MINEREQRKERREKRGIPLQMQLCDRAFPDRAILEPSE